jgi:hypothetical protein
MLLIIELICWNKKRVCCEVSSCPGISLKLIKCSGLCLMRNGLNFVGKNFRFWEKKELVKCSEVMGLAGRKTLDEDFSGVC